ncbi:MAG: hypothetical protein HY360_07020 [Verrucomicrobia bacterium]|nr:hypothetical protein [Verrucomicrobiota bacterium]
MKDDPVIAEVRRIRHLISVRCGHDPMRLMEHYRKFEKKLRKSGKFRFLDVSKTDAVAHHAN